MAKIRKLGWETDLPNGWSDNRTVPTLKTRRAAGGFLLSGNGTRRFGKALIAFFLGIAMLVGLGAGFAPSAQAASSAPSSSLVLPVQVQEAEKPDVWIETNVVLNTQKKPTGYVELVLKARTPVIYFADEEMTQLRYPGDGLETQAGRWNGTVFNAEDPDTYATSRQTTFREVAASLQYNTNLLVPVSWEHEIKYGEGADINVIQNAYPDFFAKYYVDESTLVDGGGNALEGEARSAEIRRQFADNKNLQRIAVPTLQYSTDSVSSAVSYAGGADGLISMAVNSNMDTTLPQESALAVVRFLYIGEEPIEHFLLRDNDAEYGYVVDEKFVSSWHNTQNGGSNKPAGTQLNDFFWFADDTLIKNSTVQQALIYTSGKYQENISVESDKISGINQFYATKSIYNGDEIPKEQLPNYTIATIPDYERHPTDPSKQNYTEVTPEEDTSATPTKIHRPKTDEDNIAVLATARKDGDRPFSYTSNLLFTADANQELTDGSNQNIAFKLRAGPTYRSSGGGTVDDFAAVVFVDWDDTMLGALVVPKGDARDRVEEYVEKFIHPTLRKSTAMAMDDGPAKTELLFNLSRSLDRKYTYAGNHTSDYATLATVGGSYSEAETAMSTDPAYLGKTIFPDGYTEDGVDMSGSAYPLTNKLDYAFLRRPVDWETTRKITVAEGSTYLDSNGKAVDATEWATWAIDYDGQQTPENPDDNYWYTSSWAVVRQPSKVSDVWTTFSTTGELSEAKLPAFDSETVAAGGHAYDGRSYFNADYIRATGDPAAATMTGCTAVGGAKSAAGGDMAFATYADSAYFEFANFADVQVNELFVKACYEPSEQLDWGNHYKIVSEPYYVRYDTVASTENGSVYSISFDYERIDTGGKGVRRIREPWTRVQYTIDEGAGTTMLPTGQNIIYSGANFYVGVQQNSTDIIAAEFTPTSAFLSMNYGVVEVYGYRNFVASGQRSILKNEAEVMNNYNYLTDSSLNESFENGYLYENRLGSMGYVYVATLRQILEEATSEFVNSDDFSNEQGAAFKIQYLSEATLQDLNLRIDEDGTTAAGVKRNGEMMGATEKRDALNKTRNNLYNALKIAYYHQKFDETGVIDLDWHQLQYHILYGDSTKALGTANGIDNGGAPDSQSGVLSVSNCGNYWWCRLDACSQKVTVTITSLEELFDAVEMLDDPNPDIVAAARGALEETIVEFINRTEIFKSDKQVDNIKVKADLKKFDASDVDRLIDFAQKYVKEWRKQSGDSAPVPTDSKILQKNYMLLNNTTPVGAINFDFTDGTEDGDYANSDKYKYWWFWRDEKPEEVNFSGVNADNIVDLIVEAAYEYNDGPQKNEIAWDDFKRNFKTYIERLRFRGSALGDFYDDAAKAAFTPAFTFEGDWADRETVLAEWLTDTTPDGLEQAFIDFRTDMTNMISEVASDGGNLENWRDESETVSEICGSGDAGWEQIQYYLLNGKMAANPEYYKATAGAEENGQYWWKSADTRLKNMTGSDSSWNSAFASRPTNATLHTLRQKMYDYARASGDAKNVLAEKFGIWFTQETALDLVLKNTARGGNITSLNVGSVVTRLLGLADAYYAQSQTDAAFSKLTWSQIQYYAINQITDGKVMGAKSAQKYTYNSDSTSRDWKWEALNNGWREALIPSITDLAELIRAIDAGGTALDPIADFTDLEAVGLDFVVDYKGSGDARDLLIELKTEYERLAGAGTWANLAESANLDSAWYLIQHYLKTGALSTPTSGESVLDATSAVGRGLYYWKDGWSENGWTRHATASRVGVVDFDFLKEAANSGVSARLNRMRTNGPATWNSRGLRDKTGASPSWTQIVDAIDRSNLSTITTLWINHIQFLIIHEDNANVQQVVSSLAYAESNIFYWWMNTGGQESIMLPSDLSALDGLNSGANAIMKSKLRNLATGDPASSAITDNGAIADSVSAVNIRIPPTDAEKDLDEFKVRSGLHKYTENELQTAIANLVKKVYADNAPTTAGGVAWNFVDGGVYTYNKAAYDAVCKLGVYEIQHWLATSGTSYTPTDDDKAGYWWIEKENKPESGGGPTLESLRELIIKVVALSYEAEYDSSCYDTLRELLRAELNDYGIPDAIDYPIEDIVADAEYIFTPSIANEFFMATAPFHWAQLAAWIGNYMYMNYDDAVAAYGGLEDSKFSGDIDIVEDDFWAYVDFLEGYGPDPFTASFSLRESVAKNRHRHELAEITDEDTALGDLPEIDEDANSGSDEEITEKELQNGTKDEIMEQPVVPEQSVTEPMEGEPAPDDYESALAGTEEFARPTELIDTIEYITEVQQNEEAA